MASKTLSEDLKQSFVVDSRIGAGGPIAATYVEQAAPGGASPLLLYGGFNESGP
jgi:tripartite-type tricarboxylate transporter receptor subunit TctC